MTDRGILCRIKIDTRQAVRRERIMSKKYWEQSFSMEELAMQVYEKMDEVSKERCKMKANIIIAGKTGVGKSTLINSIFGEELAKVGTGKPITQGIQKYEKEHIPIRIYDTQGLELEEAEKERVKNGIVELIDKNLIEGAKEDHIHIIWYCINCMGHRIEPAELEWVNEIVKESKREKMPIPIFIVLTHCLSIEEAEDLKKYLAKEIKGIRGIIPVLAKEYKLGGLTLPSFGLDILTKDTFKVLPEAAADSFVCSQKICIDLKIEKAKNCVKKYEKVAMGIGMTPVPVSDAALLIPEQMAMLAHITSIFGMKLNKSIIAMALGSLTGVTGATIAGKFIASSVLKLIPGAGTFAGGLISGVTASQLTKILGNAYISILADIAQSEKDVEKQMKEIFSDEKAMREYIEKAREEK